MWAIILQVIQIFFMLPKIFETIKTIIETIKLLRTPEDKAEAKKELKAILTKYRKVNKNDKQQVSEKGQSLQSELDALKAKIEKKVQGN